MKVSLIESDFSTKYIEVSLRVNQSISHVIGTVTVTVQCNYYNM